MKPVPVFLTRCLILYFSLDINANYLEVMGNFTENAVSLNSTVPHQLSLYVSTVIPKQDDTSKAASPIVTATPTYRIDNNRTKQIIPINQSSSDSASTNQDTISLESTTLNTDTEAIKLNPGTTSFLTSTVETNDKVLSGSVDLPEHSVKPSAVSITTGSTPHTRTTFNWKPYASLASKWVDFTSFTTTTTEVTETTLTDETESEDILLAVEHEGTTTLITVETIDLTTDQTSSLITDESTSLTTDETTFSTTDETTTSTTSISSSSTTAFNWKPYVPLSIQETANETTLQNDDKENQLLHELVEATSSADTQSHNSSTSLGISETAASIYTADTIPLMEITSSTSLHVPTSNTTVLTTTSSSVSLKSNIPLIEEISTAYPITNNDNISTTSSSVNSTAVSETSSTSSTDVNVTSSTSSITTTSSVLLSSTTTGATTTFNWKPFIPPNPGSQTSNEPSSTTATSIATEAAATTTNAASTTASTTSHKSHHRKGHGTAVRRMSSQSVAGILLITLTIAISCTATAVFTIQRYRRQRMLDDSVALMSSRRSHGRVYYYDTSI